MIRRFTKADWNAFSGSEKFNDGSNPFIAVFENDYTGVVIVGDINGVEVNLYSNIKDDCGGMNWQKCWNEGNNTPEEIKSFMEKLISDLGLDGDWYAPDISYALDHRWDWGFEYVGEI